MSRFVEVHRKDFVSSELTDVQWINLELVETVMPLIDGGSRIVWPGETWIDVREIPEELLSLGGT